MTVVGFLQGFTAVCKLRAKRKWVVTGTPVQNKCVALECLGDTTYRMFA
jgi:hypothetical protein